MKIIKYLSVYCLLFLLCACNHKHIQIEKFIYIEHNANRISYPEELQAKFYCEYTDSSNSLRMAWTNVWGNGKSTYFSSSAPDSLRKLIISNLFAKAYPECFSKADSFPHMYDGDGYSIIYKFKGGQEKIINYESFQLSDSLAGFALFLDRLKKLPKETTIDPFDNTSILSQYRNKILTCCPLIPEPTQEENIRFGAPVVVDSI